MPNNTYHPRGQLINGYRAKKHPLRAIWLDMKQRCSNPRNPAWKHYGGRGITYCAEWEHLANFARDMWPRPEGLELDRCNNDKNYCKENCRWVTRSVNCGNRRMFKNNPLGFTGVSQRSDGAFLALYHRDCVRYRLGSFDSASEAAAFRAAFIVCLDRDSVAALALLTRPGAGYGAYVKN